MGSVGNSNPWFQYQTFRDCSQGFCSIYCPQWCYIIFPPPPPSPFATGDRSSSSPFDFSPLIVAVIGIVASAFIIIGYFTFISKYFRRTSGSNSGNGAADSDDQISSESYQASSSSGLDEALIKSITVWKYKKNNGFVEENDHCSVCLSEFEENESLRILPKCSHPFHLPCIDTWLMSNSSCPLCRSTILPTNILPISAQQTQPPGLNLSALDSQSRINNQTVLMVQNFQEAIVVEAGSYDSGSPKHNRGRVSAERQGSEQRESIIEIGEDGFQLQPFRRSVSMTSCSYPNQASADDIFRATYNGERAEEEEEERRNLEMGIGSSRGIEKEDGRFDYRRGDLNLGMKRSISAGRILFTKE